MSGNLIWSIPEPPFWTSARLFSHRTLADGTSLIEPLNWQGSADLATLAQADCLMQLPAGEHTFAAGQSVHVFML